MCEKCRSASAPAHGIDLRRNHPVALEFYRIKIRVIKWENGIPTKTKVLETGWYPQALIEGNHPITNKGSSRGIAYLPAIPPGGGPSYRRIEHGG